MKNLARKKGKEKISGLKTILWSPVILLAIFMLGFFTPFLFMAGPIFGFSYILTKKGIDSNMPGIKWRSRILLAIRAVIIGTFMTLAVLVPFRTVVAGLIWLSPCKELQDALNEMSVDGFVDAWFGICGLSFAVIAGMMAWTRSLRLKSQIENIPTSTVRSAAMGLSEFKGTARLIGDEEKRLAEMFTDGKKKENKKPLRSKRAVSKTMDSIENNIQETILSEVFNRHSQISKIFYSRFYLEDETGKILVDPRGIDFWDGHGNLLWKPVRSIYLETRHEMDDHREMRSLLAGDPVFIIGSIEENTEAGQDASDSDRLILRPSSSMKAPDLIKRIMLGEDKQTTGTDIFDVFFLSDLSESAVKERIVRGTRGIWKWFLAYVVFSLPLVLIYGHRILDLNAARTVVMFLPGGEEICFIIMILYNAISALAGFIF